MNYETIADTSQKKKTRIERNPTTFFIYYWAALRPTLDHYRWDSATHPMLITAFIQVSRVSVKGPKVKEGLVTKLGLSNSCLNPLGRSLRIKGLKMARLIIA